MCEFFLYDGGIKVRGLPLWLDSSERKPLNFISHAHADHIGRHRRIICTPATLELLRARLPGGEALTLEFGRRHELAGAAITLQPAGHVLGSAQILIETGGTRILYTGDFRLGESLTAEFCEPLRCDVLLMESTYGHPRYVFPDREEVLSLLGEFVERCFDRSATPVLLAYSLGKAQEAIKALELLGYGAVAHPAVLKICRVYEQLGVSFPLLAPLGEGPVGRRVVVWPPQPAARAGLERLGSVRTAALTGWAHGGGRGLFGADEALPLSDHCDYPALLRAAKESGAKRIFTHHGDAARLARFLRAEGLNAEPLVPPAQGDLF